MSLSIPLPASGKSLLPLVGFKSELPTELLAPRGNQPIHVLIVDDSDESRTVYAHYLTEKGFRVSKAHGAKEALEKALGLGPDLIVLHLWLPKINGWELTRRLKSDARTRHIPVLALAGATLVLPKECDGFLRKPFQLEELADEIFHQVSVLAGIPESCRVA